MAINQDPFGIATGLKNLFAVPADTCAAMGDAGFELVKSNFSWPRIASELLSVYDWLLNGGIPPRCVHLN